MPDDARKHADDLREVVRLLVAATTGVTDVVEAMHKHIGSGPAVLGRPLERPVGLITRIAYGSVRGVTRLVGVTLDVALEKLAPFLGESTPGPERAAMLAALNGVLGDRLAEMKSPLAIPLRIDKQGDGKRVVVLIHGSSMHEGHWAWKGHHHGEMLAKEHGFAVATVTYNSGLPVMENGKLLADALESLDADEIAIVAHSMGGLVARAAIHLAGDRAWRKKVRVVVTLGTPHMGSPVERAGHFFEEALKITGYSAPLAQLAKIRSAGVMDLRHGLDLPLPDDIPFYAVAAGADVLVPVASAHGKVPPDRCLTVPGIDHLALLGNADVYAFAAKALDDLVPADSATE
jgi:pimeloyl-ACP methyl ester carboxylesterase